MKQLLLCVMLIFSSNVIQAQDSSSQFLELEYEVDTNYDLIAWMETSRIVKDPTVGYPETSNLFISVYLHDGSYSVLDMFINEQGQHLNGETNDEELTTKLFHMDSSAILRFAPNFGFIVDDSWDEIENLLSNTGSEYGWTSRHMGPITENFGYEPIDIMNIAITGLLADTDLYYEKNTGILIHASHGFTYDQQNQHFDISLKSIDDDTSFFNQFYDDQPQSSATNWLTPILIIILGIGLLGKRVKHTIRPPASGRLIETELIDIPSGQDNRSQDISEMSVDGKIMDENFVEIPIWPHKIRSCCYQTARLGESYCRCGRAVSEEIRNLFAT